MKPIHKIEIYIETNEPLDKIKKDLTETLGSEVLIDIHSAYHDWKSCVESIIEERSW